MVSAFAALRASELHSWAVRVHVWPTSGEASHVCQAGAEVPSLPSLSALSNASKNATALNPSPLPK